MSTNEALGLTIVAALVGAFSSIISIILKEYLFSRSFEKWKARQSLKNIFDKYKNPILLSASELCSRLIEICDRHPVSYLDKSLLKKNADKIEKTTYDDTYFQRYKLISSIYRFCSFLGWLELFRQEIVFLESGMKSMNQAIANSIDAVRSDLADGQLNKADDWHEWNDRFIFREEQRAIGEEMIVKNNNQAIIIGYGQFCNIFEDNIISQKNKWLNCSVNFLVDPFHGEKDFHLVRLKRITAHIVQLMELLDSARIHNHQLKAYTKYSDEIGNLK